jgi:hypothetical protein
MTTIQTAVPAQLGATAAERLASAKAQKSRLEADDAKLSERTGRALSRGEDVTALNLERRNIAAALSDLEKNIRGPAEHPALGLEGMAFVEERAALRAGMAAALERRGNLQVEIAAKRSDVDEKKAAFLAADGELFRLLNTPDGSFSASQRLTAHETAHPWIVEEHA